MYEQKQLFDFILDRVEDPVGEQAETPPGTFSISDGTGDGKLAPSSLTDISHKTVDFAVPGR
jgi:hypothetical protein